MCSAQQHRADVPSVKACANQGKRLTRVEKARLEAMASFGNCDFDSLKAKKVDFRSKLCVTPRSPVVCSEKRLTRMQLAKLEANEAFKNIKLGVDNNRPAKRKNTGDEAPERVPKVRKLTRLEQARLHANNLSLNKLPLTRQERKTIAQSGKENPKGKRQKKAQLVPKITKTVLDKEAGKTAVNVEQHLCIEKTPSGPTGSEEVINAKNVAVGNSPVLTKSVLVDFGTLKGGTTTGTISTASVKNQPTTVVSVKVLDGSTALTTTTTTSITFVNKTVAHNNESIMSTTGTQTSATGIANSSADLTPQICNSFSICRTDYAEEVTASENVTEGSVTSRRNEAAGSVVTVEGSFTEPFSVPHRLTKVQRARLEALKSFGGQGLDDVYKTSTRKLAKYLTPKRSRATKTATTPCQTDALLPYGDVAATQDDAKCVKTATTPCQTDTLPPFEDVTATQDGAKHVETTTTPCQRDALLPCRDVTTTRDDADSKSETQHCVENDNWNLNGTRHHPKPKTYLYSSINANESLGSIPALLETSRRVVQTAKLLETPP